MSDKEQGAQVPSTGSVADESEDREREWTDFGYGFATLFAGLLLFFAPWYFFGAPFPNHAATLALSIVLYAAGLVILLFGMGFFSTGLKKTPELRHLFPSLSSGEDAWEGAYGTVLALVVILVIQWIMRGLDLTGIAAVVAKLLTYFMAVLGITQVAQALDGFVIRPLIAKAAEGPQAFELWIRRVRKVAVIIGSAVAFLAAIATIFDVF